MTVTYSTKLPANPSAQLKVALKMIEAGTAFDAKEFAAYTTEDYTHVFLPENAGLSRFTKAEFLARIDEMGALFASMSVSIVYLTDYWILQSTHMF